jgi:endonuclease/exonuclease/phosphatase family metal-dependent hydrolase
LIIFGVGRLATDRWHATQYLHWLPSVPLVVAALVGLLVSRAAWRRSQALRHAQAAVLVTLVAALLWVLLVEWRIQHAVVGPAPGPSGLTLVHFNASGKPAPALPGAVLALEPDVVIFANLRSRGALPDVLQALSPAAGASRDASQSTPMASLVHADRFTVVSRARIIEFGHTTLGFDGAIFLNTTMPDLRDPGTAAWFRLDTTVPLGREIVVWAMDLPSDPRLHRREMMTRALDAIGAWDGPTFVRQEGGNYAPLAGAAAHGFPKPDVIIGDFNTPGGSAALAEFARRAGGGSAMRDAHAAAGLGPDGTFPSMLPTWLGLGLDRAFVSERLRVTRRDVHGVPPSQHRAQRVTVSPADAPAASRTPPRP